MRIVRLNQHPEVIDTVVAWFVNQWGLTSESARESLADQHERPPALVAMKDCAPLGVMAFKVHQLQPPGTAELWINALYVAPPYRQQGIGSRLVRAGVRAAATCARESLYVYTDIPEFYEALGWRRFSYSDQTKMHVLEYKLQLLRRGSEEFRQD